MRSIYIAYVRSGTQMLETVYQMSWMQIDHRDLIEELALGKRTVMGMPFQAHHGLTCLLPGRYVASSPDGTSLNCSPYTLKIDGRVLYGWDDVAETSMVVPVANITHWPPKK